MADRHPRSMAKAGRSTSGRRGGRAPLGGPAARRRGPGCPRPSNGAIGDGGGRAPELPSRPGPAADPSPMITASNLRFGFDRHEPVIRDVHLRIDAGERVALVGPNGSGQVHARSSPRGPPAPGHGCRPSPRRDPARLPPAELARRAAYVFQDPERKFLAQTVEEEVLLGLRFAQRPVARILMGRMGLPLDRFGRRSPYRLSGGEQPAAFAGHRARARTCRARARRADIRAGPSRLRGPAQRSSMSAWRPAPRSSPRRTTNASWRTPRRVPSGSTGAGSCPTSGRRDLRPTELDEPRLASPLGRVSPVVKLAIALAWLVGLAFTTRYLLLLFLARAAPWSPACGSDASGAHARAGHGAALGRRGPDRGVEHVVRRGQRRSDRGGAAEHRADPHRDGRRCRRSGPRVPGHRHRLGRCGVLVDDRPDAARGFARPAGAGLAAFRVRGAGGLSGDPRASART